VRGEVSGWSEVGKKPGEFNHQKIPKIKGLTYFTSLPPFFTPRREEATCSLKNSISFQGAFYHPSVVALLLLDRLTPELAT